MGPQVDKTHTPTQEACYFVTLFLLICSVKHICLYFLVKSERSSLLKMQKMALQNFW